MRRQIYTIFNFCGSALSGLLLFLLLMHSVGNSVYADLEAQLIFLEDALILSPNEANKHEGHFTLQNKGAAVNILGFKVFLTDENGLPINNPPTLTVTLKSNTCPCEMSGYDLAQFQIEVASDDQSRTLTGYLEIDADDRVVSEALPLTLKAKQATAYLFDILPATNVTTGNVIIISLGVAVLTFLLGLLGIWLCNKGDIWCNIKEEGLGIISWDIKKNWLANITGLSAITLAVIALNILPESTQFLIKNESINEFTALNTIFGLGIIVAPLIGAMLTTIWSVKKEKEATSVWIFILAVSIVMWSVTGVLLTAIIFFEEIRAGGMMDQFALNFLQVSLLLIWLVAFVYVIIKVAKTPKEIDNRQEKNGLVADSKPNIYLP